jgi:hypothetical protein
LNTSTVCEDCPDSNCLTCDDSTGECNACDNDFTLRVADKFCKRDCGGRTYWLGDMPNTCATCLDTNCTACDELTGLCNDCDSTYTLRNSDKFCKKICSGRTYWLGDTPNTCATCLDSNCTACDEITGLCNNCDPTYTLRDSDKFCKKDCI